MLTLLVSPVPLILILAIRLLQTPAAEGYDHGGDIYIAQTEQERLFYVQRPVAEAFLLYLAKERDRLAKIEIRVQQLYLQTLPQAPHHIVQNPINAFHLLRAMSQHLDDMVAQAHENKNAIELKAMIDVIRRTENLPGVADVAGAALGLHRLQETYLIDTGDIARGDLGEGRCCATGFSADDCFEVGRHLHDAGEHTAAVTWLEEALHRNAAQAIGLRPDPAFAALVFRYLTQSQHHCSKGHGTPEPDPNYLDLWLHKAQYERACRGEGQRVQPPRTECRYATKGEPYFMIGPLKEEVAHGTEPIILVYHDVVHDSEIRAINELAALQLVRSAVYTEGEDRPKPTQHRISKSAEVSKTEAQVRGLYRRISLITGLAMESAEDVHVTNYGLGGHIQLHYDSNTEEGFFGLDRDRLATFFMYLSDVEAGGGTAFVYLNVTIWPRRGSAAFWYNIREDGSPDLLTLHGGCPVLLGSKWVANAWIHEGGQELRRPCPTVRLEPSISPMN